MTVARLAVLGDPLTFTRSPDLHRAGFRSLGVEGSSEALPTPATRLAERLHQLDAAGFRGVNLTRPLKQMVIPFLRRVSETAAEAGSVNTVGFDREGWWGDTTDGPGLLDLLGTIGRRPRRLRTVLLGAGGAARSLGAALARAGVLDLVVSARRTESAKQSWCAIHGHRIVSWGSAEERSAVARADLVVNATPLGAGDDLLPLDAVSRASLVLDLNYGPHTTPWVMRARERGIEAYDGLGLLVFQARRSLELWFGRAPAVDPLVRAVGWPR